MNNFFLLLFVFLLAQGAVGQSLVLNGNIVIAEPDSEGAKMTVFKNNDKIDEQVISKKGRFETKLAFDADYKISFEKAGYITKSVNVNTEIPSEILETNPNFPPIKLIINLLPKVEGVDLSIFDQPVAILAYNDELDDFIFDKDYSEKIKERVAKSEKEVRQMLARKGSEALEKERLFATLVDKGQNYSDQKKWTDAINTWKQAQTMKPDNKDVEERIAQAAKELELEDARRSIEQQNALAYKLLVKSGDSLFSLKFYTQAKDKYTDATKLNKQDSYPSKKLNEINVLLAKEAENQKKAAEAETNYQKIIASADNAYQTENYPDAITAYQQAITLKPTDKYPRDMIARAEQGQKNKTQALAAEEEKKRQDEQKKAALKKEYDKIVAEADHALKGENYTLAKLRYTEAEQLNTGEEYPKKQLQEIEQIVHSSQYKTRLAEYNKSIAAAEKAMQAKNYASAKFYYQQAIAQSSLNKEAVDQKISEIDKLIEAEQLAAINKAYNEHMGKADKAYKEKAYAVAKFYYLKALDIKKDDKYAKEKLSEVEKLTGERQEKSVEL